MNNLATASRNRFIAQHYANTPEEQTQVPILFTIIHIHNISKSRLNQLYQWKEYEDPNSVSVDRVNKSKNKARSKGPRDNNRLISEINLDDATGDTNVNVNTGWASNDVYKLTLKDNFDNYCYAYENNDKLAFIRAPGNNELPLSIPLGGRLIVNKGAAIMNGVLMLKNSNCQYLGVDEHDSAFSEQLNSNLVGKYIASLRQELGVADSRNGN